jgi:hypothetical protein
MGSNPVQVHTGLKKELVTITLAQNMEIVKKSTIPAAV